MRTSGWRIAGGMAVLAVLLAAAVVLAPSYVSNLKLQQYVEQLVRDPETRGRPDELIRIDVADRAARLGIRLKPEEVRIDRGAGGLRIEARYIVRVDLPVYTVDLHFRAGSGAR